MGFAWNDVVPSVENASDPVVPTAPPPPPPLPLLSLIYFLVQWISLTGYKYHDSGWRLSRPESDRNFKVAIHIWWWLTSSLYYYYSFLLQHYWSGPRMGFNMVNRCELGCVGARIRKRASIYLLDVSFSFFPEHVMEWHAICSKPMANFVTRFRNKATTTQLPARTAHAPHNTTGTHRHTHSHTQPHTA